MTVYAVASGKGGVGKTATTAALGTTLAAAGATVAVVDGDLGMANLGPTLGVDDGGPTLHDVLAGDAPVAAATRVGPHDLSVVPGAADVDAFTRGDPARLGPALAAVDAAHDHVLVDVGAGLSAATVAALRAADETLLVATPARDAVADAARTAEAVSRVDGAVRGARRSNRRTPPTASAVRSSGPYPPTRRWRGRARRGSRSGTTRPGVRRPGPTAGWRAR
jgi:septum site-determining protein MinD